MSAAILKVQRSDAPQMLFAIGFLIAGILIVLGAICFLWGWFTDQYPTGMRDPIWITPTAIVLPGSQFSAGLPRNEVTMPQFIKLSYGKPFVISYWNGWEQQDFSSSDTSGYHPITYSMEIEKGGMKMYVVAYHKVPNFNKGPELRYWKAATTFKKELYTFLPVVYGTEYWSIAPGILLMIVGCFCLFVWFLISGDLYEKLQKRI